MRQNIGFKISYENHLSVTSKCIEDIGINRGRAYSERCSYVAKDKVQ